MLTRLSILVFLVLVVISISVAQKTVHVKTYNRKDGTVVTSHNRSAPGKVNKPSSESDANAEIGSDDTQTQRTSTYDRFTDETTVRVRYFHPLQGVNMEASYKYRGQADRIVPPKVVHFLFVVIGEGRYLDTNAELFILSDEKSFRFAGDSAFSQSITSLAITIPFDKFESIMAAKKIEMRLGLDDLALSEADLTALRAFLPQRIKP